jgi:hypothetical protein
MNTRRKLGLHAQTLGTVLSRFCQADASGAQQELDRGAQADARGSCLSLVLDRGAEAYACGAARCASQVLDRGVQAGGQTEARGNAALSQQEKSTWQMSRGTELAAQTHFLAVAPQPAPAARLGVASGVDAPLSTCFVW